MIRTRTALFRQVQDFFHSHLLGIYDWEEAEPYEPQKREKEPGKPREAGKFHDVVEMRFGPFDLIVYGPFEDERHPCGLIRIDAGAHQLEGPLDPSTWDRVAKFVKQHDTEEDHGSKAGSDWGR